MCKTHNRSIINCWKNELPKIKTKKPQLILSEFIQYSTYLQYIQARYRVSKMSFKNHFYLSKLFRVKKFFISNANTSRFPLVVFFFNFLFWNNFRYRKVMNRLQRVHPVFPSVNWESTFVKAKKLTLVQ